MSEVNTRKQQPVGVCDGFGSQHTYLYEVFDSQTQRQVRKFSGSLIVHEEEFPATIDLPGKDITQTQVAMKYTDGMHSPDNVGKFAYK